MTATGAIKTVISSTCMEGCTKLLDVGGGDGSIAIALTDQYKTLHATVFNLPASALLARNKAAEHACDDRVAVVEGDFLKDELSKEPIYDRIMFSRVLTDWTPTVLLHEIPLHDYIIFYVYFMKRSA